MEQFEQLCHDEYTVKHNAIADDYRQRRQHLQQRQQQQVAEYKFMHSLLQLNTLALHRQTDPALVMQVEQQLAALNYHTVLQSFTLQHWRTQFGESFILPVLADVLNYFLCQFTVKHNLTDLQIAQLVSKLLAQQPHLRIMELVYVLNQALAGTYGPTYQHIGIDTLLGWLTQYYSHSAAHLEHHTINHKPEEARGLQPWRMAEQQLKQYEQQQRQKKAIAERVWQHEARAREVQQYKDQILNNPA